jgi:hypothetical protein
MRLGITSTIVILFFILLILVIIVCVLFRKKKCRIDAFWLLKNDRQIASIVSSLSYLSSIRTHRNYIFRKKKDLTTGLRKIILSYMPDSPSEDIDAIYNDLLSIVERIRKKRSELIFK